jgi:hypothetical protein
MGFLLGYPLEKNRTILDHIYHYPHFTPSSPYLLGFLGVLTQEGIVHHFMGRRGIFRCTDPRRDCPSFHGKKGLKAQRECSWKKIKSNHKPFICSPRDPVENEMSLIRN